MWVPLYLSFSDSIVYNSHLGKLIKNVNPWALSEILTQNVWG